ncbi:hypothetical protein [Lachnoanaerobaculum orale]|uniref:hypothetical protein n=1 Tax=Lachnoanaerobaculum orale TaxID=979627 RepID=UPI0023A8D3D8|nr:hypothetical protein [Lachnoanaerobaculum orale]
MEYYDEQIVKALHIQRRDTFGSIDDGLYINNELIRFNKTLLFNNRVSVMLPENFVPMLPEIVEVKYFSGRRPDEIYTSLDMSVNFTFTDLGISGNDEDTRLAAGLIKQIIRNANPGYEFFEENEDIEKEVIINRFDFKSYGIDDEAYNIMYLASTGNSLIQGTFNCLYRDRIEWKRAALEVIKTVSMYHGGK